jgi:1-acyl-sn-glycerol-3-phosphate acyltransferase
MMLHLVGWHLEGTLPDLPKFVVIAAPHRSNWDFVIGLGVKFALNLEVSWLGKHTLFKKPFGWLFRFWGGIPVNRGKSHDTVAQVVDQFVARDRLILTIAPEGTRTPGTPWKTGFWHIAKGAGVPIVPMAFDWENNAVRLMPPLWPTELDRDMATLQELYAPFRGPES